MLDDKTHATLARELGEAVHNLGALLDRYGDPLNEVKVLTMLLHWSRRDFDIEGSIHDGDLTLREDRAPDVPKYPPTQRIVRPIFASDYENSARAAGTKVEDAWFRSIG